MDKEQKSLTKMKNTIVIFLGAFLIALLSVSCKEKKETASTSLPTTEEIAKAEAEATAAAVEQAKKDTFLVYHRGACFGMCPIFNLVVYQDGHAIYEGRNHVNRIGTYQTQINPAALQKVIDAANKIGYFSLQDSYDNPHVTDLPTILTGISKDGKVKMVANRYHGPQGLKFLYDELDQMIEVQDWQKMKTDE